MKQKNENTPIKPAAFDDGSAIRPVKFEPPPSHKQRFYLQIRTGTVAVTIALLVCAGLAWYILTGKAVYIEARPDAAQIELSGGFRLKLADRYLLRKGDYQLAITAEGYHTLQRTLTVTDEQNQHYAFSLRRLPGHLEVETTPPPAAEVWLNENSVGQTPLTLTGLQHGKYHLRLLAERYLPFETEMEIEGYDRQQSLTVELKPAWANVRLQSKPPGADIFVDDVLVGKTPVAAEILQGERKLRIKHPGYKDWRKTLRITAGEHQTIDDIQLEPADAILQISTRPADASVTVDGEYKGQSPVEVALAPGVRTTVRVFKQGYEQTSRTVEVQSGDNRTLRIDLNPETGAVRILASPADARLYINGDFSGLADKTLELPATPHTIEIRKEGYVDYKTTVTPRAGFPQQVRAALKTLEQARREAVKPVIDSPGGQRLKLFEATVITMGASRREPGRRANETIRDVQFVRPFYLSENVVTNAEFRRFDRGHSSGQAQGNNLNGDKQPVVNITWDQAALYCNWLSEQASLKPFYRVNNGQITGINREAEGYRLPTEAEWAWAARDRGFDQPPLRFPWGDEMPPPPRSGNFADASAANILGNIIPGYNDGHIVTSPVANFPANAKGLYDIGGNVAEWVHDFYDIIIPSPDRVETDPPGPDAGENRVIRGSSWKHGTITELRLSFRDYGTDKRDDVGFRVARYLE